MINFFYSNLKYLREQKKLSQSELARRTIKICEEYNQQSTGKIKATPITQASIARWEANENSPSVDNLVILARALDVSLPELIGSDLKIDNADVIVEEKRKIKIPVLGKIPAGVPIEAIEDILGYEEIPEDWIKNGNKYFALLIDGDSMEPEYKSNDIIIVKQTPTCDSGNDCVVLVNGFDATFKRVIKELDGIKLKPLNNDYETQKYTKEQIINEPVIILGVAKEVRRKLNE